MPGIGWIAVTIKPGYTALCDNFVYHRLKYNALRGAAQVQTGSINPPKRFAGGTHKQYAGRDQCQRVSCDTNIVIVDRQMPYIVFDRYQPIAGQHSQ